MSVVWQTNRRLEEPNPVNLRVQLRYGLRLLLHLDCEICHSYDLAQNEYENGSQIPFLYLCPMNDLCAMGQRLVARHSSKISSEITSLRESS